MQVVRLGATGATGLDQAGLDRTGLDNWCDRVGLGRTHPDRLDSRRPFALINIRFSGVPGVMDATITALAVSARSPSPIISRRDVILKILLERGLIWFNSGLIRFNSGLIFTSRIRFQHLNRPFAAIRFLWPRFIKLKEWSEGLGFTRKSSERLVNRHTGSIPFDPL